MVDLFYSSACGGERFGWDCEHECGTAKAVPTCSGSVFCMPDPVGCSCMTGWMGAECNEGKLSGRNMVLYTSKTCECHRTFLSSPCELSACHCITIYVWQGFHKGELQNSTGSWPPGTAGSGQLPLFRTIATGQNRRFQVVNRRLSFEAVPNHPGYTFSKSVQEQGYKSKCFSSKRN